VLFRREILPREYEHRVLPERGLDVREVGFRQLAQIDITDLRGERVRERINGDSHAFLVSRHSSSVYDTRSPVGFGPHNP
jgi:hypothetical protein